MPTIKTDADRWNLGASLARKIWDLLEHAQNGEVAAALVLVSAGLFSMMPEPKRELQLDLFVKAIREQADLIEMTLYDEEHE